MIPQECIKICVCPQGGLFGSSTFSQPVTSSTSSGFGFGATSGTSNSLFGSTNTGGGGLFTQQNNTFGANKPATFGSKFPAAFQCSYELFDFIVEVVSWIKRIAQT